MPDLGPFTEEDVEVVACLVCHGREYRCALGKDAPCYSECKADAERLGENGAIPVAREILRALADQIERLTAERDRFEHDDAQHSLQLADAIDERDAYKARLLEAEGLLVRCRDVVKAYKLRLRDAPAGVFNGVLDLEDGIDTFLSRTGESERG